MLYLVQTELAIQMFPHSYAFIDTEVRRDGVLSGTGSLGLETILCALGSSDVFD